MNRASCEQRFPLLHSTTPLCSTLKKHKKEEIVFIKQNDAFCARSPKAKFEPSKIVKRGNSAVFFFLSFSVLRQKKTRGKLSFDFESTTHRHTRYIKSLKARARDISSS
jgi:hypothetical protein